jgi:hypothetical protein
VRPQGVQEGVQTCGFVRGSRGAGKPMVAPCQFLPASRQNGQIGHDLPVLYFLSLEPKEAESG